ncbi:MurR/RpiR family transcriptional regulator [Paraburkholderia susongensis]|uniref:MurR/RpiR family transcriptional regulator n=1 Tax=Paraburkholderia susongensis TaxID=1515439 RepID=UPI001FCA4689|nr:MurR/RpiR family transcriptional regulator [Paraburkholderia susongensis]
MDKHQTEPDNPPLTIDKLVEQRFSALSPKLREAARFVIDRPEEIAMNSMRTAAVRASVHPSTMLRLARELGFDSYEPFRDEFRTWLANRGAVSWAGRAETLRGQRTDSHKEHLIEKIVDQEVFNLRNTFEPRTISKIVEARTLFGEARNVYVLGLRSLFPVAFYLNYVCRMFNDKTVLMMGVGGTFADELRTVDERDVMIVFSYRPYARDTLKAVKFARSCGTRIVAVTDSKVSPIATCADVAIPVLNTTPSLFPSIGPAFLVAQALVSLLVAESGEDTMAKIARSERQLTEFGVYVSDNE